MVVTLAGPARLSFVTVDTGYFLGNAPGRVRISARSTDNEPWHEILAEAPVSPDSRNRFRLQDDEEVTAVRVDVYPDGGFSRLHLLGQLSPQALSAAISQWLLRLTAQASSRVLLGGAPVRELTEQATAEPGLVARRPRGNAPGAGRAAPCRTSVTMADISAMSRRCNIRRLRSAC
jgi:allantoicase